MGEAGEITSTKQLTTTQNHPPKTDPFVSIIMIARNEEDYIEKAINSLMTGTYSIEHLELLLVDGCSDDRTIEIVQDTIDRTGWPVRILRNKRKLQANAFNIGIMRCKGRFIARADAHSTYPEDYIAKLVAYARQYPDVDNIGGVWDIHAASDRYMANAIAAAYSHRFATGNALYRVGVDKPTLADTVPFGFFRREVFEKYGYFDTELLRNEDGEFNHRIIRNGGKVLLVPDVSIKYYARAGLGKLAQTFYQYGWFKPLAQAKLKRPVNFRQFAPLVFLFVLIALVARAAIASDTASLFAAGSLIGVYTILTIASAFGAARKKGKSPLLVPGICLAFWTMHLSFTLGYLRGILLFLILGQRPSDIPMSR